MKIMKCTCKHEQQDKLHGEGMRVHNPTLRLASGKSRELGHRCTVCGAIN